MGWCSEAPSLGHEREPAVAAPIEMKQVSKAGPGLAAAAVAAPSPALADQPSPRRAVLRSVYEEVTP